MNFGLSYFFDKVKHCFREESGEKQSVILITNDAFQIACADISYLFNVS